MELEQVFRELYAAAQLINGYGGSKARMLLDGMYLDKDTDARQQWINAMTRAEQMIAALDAARAQEQKPTYAELNEGEWALLLSGDIDPSYEWIAHKNAQGIVDEIDNGIDCLVSGGKAFEGETLTYTITVARMSNAEFEALEEI